MSSTIAKPTFETVPREISDQIYDYLLIHDEVIIPFPVEYKREEIGVAGGKAAKRIAKFPLDSDQPLPVWDGELGHQHYAAHLPCVALLGVNSRIQKEAAVILFGRNVWRVSSIPNSELDENENEDNTFILNFYQRYEDSFCRIEARFDMRDIPLRALM